jgi:micrococcal nuclease
MRGSTLAVALGATLGLGAGWACVAGSGCGPDRSVIARVIDGDTVELEDGERVRYLLVDTPEITNGKNDCFGAEARDFNRDLVEGREVELSYDRECRDTYDRLLAYVSLDGRDVNALLVERGYACVLHIPPNGEERIDEFESLEDEAMAGMVGLWGACAEVTCD